MILGIRDETASRIKTWLLAGPAQQQEGPHAGAIAGWIGVDGRARYVYPEITGYFLQWLAWIAERDGVQAIHIDRAAAAQQWLARWLESRDLSTRIYLGPRDDGEWRNSAVFTFDLAMVLRGIGAAARAQLIAPERSTIERLLECLIALIADDGELDACSRPRHGASLPDRWSTRRGAFLAKAAAGIIDASTTLNIPDVLRQAAERTFESSIAALLRHPHEETHPFLYAVEGLLSFSRDSKYMTRLPEVERQFERLLAMIVQIGRVPERLSHDGPRRLDVVAQTIRVGLLMNAHRSLSATSSSTIDDLANELIGQIRRDGSVPFDSDAEGIELNVWTAMFAEQALWLSARDTEELGPIAANPRIV